MPRNLKRVRQGDPITASSHNALVDTANLITRLRVSAPLEMGIQSTGIYLNSRRESLRQTKRVQLTGAVNPSTGLAKVKFVQWDGSAYSLVDPEIDAYDFTLQFTAANVGAQGYAGYFADRGVWELLTLELAPQVKGYAYLYSSNAFNLGTTFIPVTNWFAPVGVGTSLTPSSSGTITVNTTGDYFIFAGGYGDISANTTTNIQAHVATNLALDGIGAYAGCTNSVAGITVPSGFTTHQLVHRGWHGVSAIAKNLAAGTVLSLLGYYSSSGCTVVAATFSGRNFGVIEL